MAANQNPLPLDERSTNMTDQNITRYRHTRFYIIDARDPHVEQDEILGVVVETVHDKKIEYAKAIFETLFEGGEINSVYFDQNATARTFNEYWDEQLARCQEGDLLVIYYHGTAGGEDAEYSWRFENPPNEQPINAYSFIRKIHNSPADALILLDCYIQTRFTRKWNHRAHPENMSTTEIISAPAAHRTTDGICIRHRHDFTEAIARDLQEFRDLKQGWSGNRDPPRWKLVTIPQVLARDRRMYSNPIRHWLQKPKKNKKEPERIRRFKFDPQLVRLTGRLEFFAHEIQSLDEQ